MNKDLARAGGLLVILGLVVVFSSGCIGPQEGTDEQKTVTLRITGSTTALPFVAQAAEEFNALGKDVQVSVSGGGSGAGIKDLGEGRSSIAMISREVTGDERKSYDTAGKKLTEIMIGYDAIVLVVSPEVYDGGIKAVTREQVKAIYAGNITNWKEIGGPDKEIYVIGRKAGSGTRDTFNELVMGNKGAETPGVQTEAEGNAEVKTAIVGSDVAIGYVGISYVDNDVRAIKLDGVTASVETIKTEDYGLARKLYLVTLGEPSPQQKEFLDFVTGAEGQIIAEENGFVPL